MPEVLGSPPSPRAALFWNGTAWQWALVDAAGHLQIDTVASALPAGAATEATLASADGYLGLLAVLWNCLRTVGTDRFMVKGEDQLFSFMGKLALLRSAAISGAGGFVDSSTPGAGVVWVVTNVAAYDRTSPTTSHGYSLPYDAVLARFYRQTEAFGAGIESCWSGHLYLEPTDVVRVYFTGALAGDTCDICLTGYQMTLET